MSKASGLVLILAGLGVAAYMMPRDIDMAPLAPSPAPPSRSDIAKTPASPAAGGINLAVGRDGARVDERPSAPAPKPPAAYKPAAAPPAAGVEPQPWRTAPVVVTVPRRPSEPAARAAVGQVQPAATPPDPAQLALALQKELRRVGCYWGEINGAWTASTRQAMKAFMDRVNATLPIEQPDYILLAMVQNHADKACGKPCPAGQGLAEDGRCMPNAIIAKRAAPPAAVTAARETARSGQPRETRETPAPVISGWTTTATAAAPTLSAPPLDGRMALAGPAGQPKLLSPTDDRAHLAATAPYAEPPLGPPLAAAAPEPRRPAPGANDRRPPRYAQPSQNWSRTVFKRLESVQP